MPDVEGTWFSLISPGDPTELDRVMEAAGDATIDVTHHTALLGSKLKASNASAYAQVGRDLYWSGGQDHAATLVQAEIVQIISCLLGQPLDFAALDLGPDLSNQRIVGAIHSMNMAREEGLILSLGLVIGPETMTQASHRMKVADIDFLVCPSPRLHPEILQQAREWGKQICVSNPLDWGAGCSMSILPSVQSAAEELGVDPTQALLNDADQGDAMIVHIESTEDIGRSRSDANPAETAAKVGEAALAAWHDRTEWESLLEHNSDNVRKAAKRRLSQL